jgi:hypothetical protein
MNVGAEIQDVRGTFPSDFDLRFLLDPEFFKKIINS